MATLKGLNKVLRNLNKEIKKIRLYTKEGLTEAALIIKADSVKNTPVDLANLRGSAFIHVTDNNADNVSPIFKGEDSGKLSMGHSLALSESKAIVQKSKFRYTGIVGYSAYYALWVHEMPAYYNFNDGTNQFLLKSLVKNKKRVLASLIKHARIK